MADGAERSAGEGGYRLILCATDGSDFSRRAGEVAAALARQAGARLLGLFVIDLKLAGYGGALYSKEWEEAMRQEGELALSELEGVATSRGVPFKGIIAVGIPKSRIGEVAAEEGADLIVVGSHGRTGLVHLFMGSVAEAVVRHAPCDVLVVRRGPGRGAATG